MTQRPASIPVERACRGDHSECSRCGRGVGIFRSSSCDLFVCSTAHGNCCCGWTEKGRARVNKELYQAEWERRGLRSRLHLSFTGCLGPCAVGNNSMLQVFGRSIWFKDLNQDELIPLVFDYAQSMLEAGRVLPPPAELSAHTYERYLLLPEGGNDTVADRLTGEEWTDLERLDPVCFMAVDPATARHWADFQGRRVYFCAPSCKKLFLANSTVYSSG